MLETRNQLLKQFMFRIIVKRGLLFPVWVSGLFCFAGLLVFLFLPPYKFEGLPSCCAGD